jgi:hypothetical protein
MRLPHVPCSHLHRGIHDVHLRAGELFHCIDVVGCGAVMDRDEHAARNIVIKVGTEAEVARRALLAEVD